MKDIFEDYLWLPQLVISIHQIHFHTLVSAQNSFFSLDFSPIRWYNISSTYGGTAIFLIAVQWTQLAPSLISLHRGTPVLKLYRSKHAHRTPPHLHHIRGRVLGNQRTIFYPQAQSKVGSFPLFPRGRSGRKGILHLPIRGFTFPGEDTHPTMRPAQHPLPWRTAPLRPGT